MNDEMSTTKEERVIWEENVSTEPQRKLENNGVLDVCDTTTVISELKEKDLSTGTTKTKISGIYKIVNKVNGKYYVGSSCNILGERWRKHRQLLRKNKHYNKHLQNAWNKYGETNFKFVIVQEDESVNLLKVEQKYLDLASSEQNKCYNLTFESIGPLKGRHLTEEHKSKIGMASRGRFLGEKNPMYGKTGNKHPMYGKHHTLESNRRNSEANKIAQKGEKNARYDHKIYTFINSKNKEEFCGTKYQFYKKYNLSSQNVCGLVNNKKGIMSVKGWIINKERYLTKGYRNIITKRVFQFDKYTNKLVRIYNSVNEAVKEGFNRRTIYNICNNNRPSAYGYVWKYEDDCIKTNTIDPRPNSC